MQDRLAMVGAVRATFVRMRVRGKTCRDADYGSTCTPSVNVTSRIDESLWSVDGRRTLWRSEIGRL